MAVFDGATGAEQSTIYGITEPFNALEIFLLQSKETIDSINAYPIDIPGFLVEECRQLLQSLDIKNMNEIGLALTTKLYFLTSMEILARGIEACEIYQQIKQDEAKIALDMSDKGAYVVVRRIGMKISPKLFTLIKYIQEYGTSAVYSYMARAEKCPEFKHIQNSGKDTLIYHKQLLRYIRQTETEEVDVLPPYHSSIRDKSKEAFVAKSERNIAAYQRLSSLIRPPGSSKENTYSRQNPASATDYTNIAKDHFSNIEDSLFNPDSKIEQIIYLQTYLENLYHLGEYELAELHSMIIDIFGPQSATPSEKAFINRLISKFLCEKTATEDKKKIAETTLLIYWITSEACKRDPFFYYTNTIGYIRHLDNILKTIGDDISEGPDAHIHRTGKIGEPDLADNQGKVNTLTDRYISLYIDREVSKGNLCMYKGIAKEILKAIFKRSSSLYNPAGEARYFQAMPTDDDFAMMEEKSRLQSLVDSIYLSLYSDKTFRDLLSNEMFSRELLSCRLTHEFSSIFIMQATLAQNQVPCKAVTHDYNEVVKEHLGGSDYFFRDN